MNLFEPFPPKPKHMRWLTYWHLCVKAEHTAHTYLGNGLGEDTREKRMMMREVYFDNYSCILRMVFCGGQPVDPWKTVDSGHIESEK